MGHRRRARVEGELGAVPGRHSLPKLQEGIAGGFTSRPQETVFEVHNLQP